MLQSPGMPGEMLSCSQDPTPDLVELPGPYGACEETVRLSQTATESPNSDVVRKTWRRTMGVVRYYSNQRKASSTIVANGRFTTKE